MKINQQKSAIEAFNGAVQGFKNKQQRKILSAMRRGRTYTGQQLAHLTNLTPNVISARLFELRESKLVKRPENKRKVCPYSRLAVHYHVKTRKACK
jgi:DNA-binding HxlR family transcriptional regulator